MHYAIASTVFPHNHMNGGNWAIVIGICLLILLVTQSGNKKSKA